MNTFKGFLREEDGAVAIEYALLAALIAVAIIAGARLVGVNLCAILNGIATGLAAPTTASFAPAAC